MLTPTPGRSFRWMLGPILCALGWVVLSATSFGQSYYPQPVAGAQRGVVRYHRGPFGGVHYKNRYGMGVSDNGVAVFGQFFDAAKTLVPVILDATSPLPSGSGGGQIPETSGGQGRTGEARSGGVDESWPQQDLQALEEMKALNARLEDLRTEYGLPPRVRTGVEARSGDVDQGFGAVGPSGKSAEATTP